MPTTGTSESVTAPAALIETYLPLVGHLVREASVRLPAHLTAVDLVPAGLYALCATAYTPEPTALPFAQVAMVQIRTALAAAVRAPRHGRRTDSAAVREALVEVLGREPRDHEIARVLGIRDTAPADRPAPAHPAPTSSGAPGRADRTADVRAAMARLPEQLRVIVGELYLKQRRLAEVAAELDITETEAARLRSLALAELGALLASSGPARSDRPASAAASLASRAALAAQVPASHRYSDHYSTARQSVGA